MPLSEDQIVSEIIKANATEVYRDSAQPAVRVLGKPLAQCISLFSTPVGRMAEIIEKNIHKYIDKLEGISEADLVSPNTRILVPILEKLRYIDDEKVSDYYAEILACASQKSHAQKAMLTYIEILNRITSDEIFILEYINSNENVISISEIQLEEAKKYGLPVGTTKVLLKGSLPVLDVNIQSINEAGYLTISKNFNLLDESLVLQNPENVDLYIDNLISLGLLEKKYKTTFAINKIYEHLENHPKIQVMKGQIVQGQRLDLDRGRIDTTSLGLKLLNFGMNKK